MILNLFALLLFAAVVVAGISTGPTRIAAIIAAASAFAAYWLTVHLQGHKLWD